MQGFSLMKELIQANYIETRKVPLLIELCVKVNSIDKNYKKV